MEKSISKRLFSFILVIAMVMTFVPFNYDIQAKAATPSGFHVSGTKILDSNGNEFVMRGVNHAHQWYQSDLDTALSGIGNYGANCVRVVLSTGKHNEYVNRGWVSGAWGDCTKTSASTLESIIQKSLNNGLVPIVEVHDATGVDQVEALKDCADYWTESSIASVLKKYSDQAILNIANEWHGSHNGSAWASGYKQVIPQIRNAGIKNLIMVDSAGWGQSDQALLNNGKEVVNADSQGNTVLSVHMYSCYDSDSKVTNLIDGVLNQNIPLVVGEFGWQHSGTNVAVNKIFDYCDEKHVGWLAWSWYGNGGTDANLDMTQNNDPSGNSLTSWGRMVKEHMVPPIDELRVTCTPQVVVWTGSAVKPTLTVTYGTKTLSSSEYSATYKDNVNEGTATVTVSYNGKTASTTFQIKKNVVPTTKVIWTGSVDLDNWNGMVSIDTSKFTAISSTSKVIGLTANFASSSKGQIQLAYNDANGDWQKIVDYVAYSGTSYTFDLTDAEISALNSSKGIFVKGSAGTVTSVELVTEDRKDPTDLANATVKCNPSTNIWTGSAITPTVKVTDANGNVLTAGLDYKVTYSDNVDVGTGKATVTGMNSYHGTKTATFTIEKNIGKDKTILWTGDYATGNFDAFLSVDTGIGSWAKATLKVDVEITGAKPAIQVAYADEAQGAWTYLPGQEEDQGTFEVEDATFSLPLNEAQIAELENAQKLYFKGRNITIKQVYVEGAILGGMYDDTHTGTEVWSGSLDFPNWDVLLHVEGGLNTLTNNKTDGACIRVDFDYNNTSRNASMQLAYGDPVTGEFTVLIRSVQPRSNSYTFRLTPEQISTLADAKEIIIKGSGFTAKKVTVITDGGNPIPPTPLTKSISDCQVSVPQVTFNGGEQKPAVTVKDGTKTLVNGTDYTVAYSDNIKAGTATATITGKGNYKGTVKKNFKIIQKSLKYCDVSLSYSEVAFNGSAKKPTVKVKIGNNVMYSGNYTVKYTNNIKAGTATVTITGKNNLQGTVTKTFKIVPKSMKYCTVTLSGDSFNYTGKEIKPSVTVKITEGAIYNSNYTVTYKNNTNKGTATVVITGKNNLTGSVTKTFTIK